MSLKPKHRLMEALEDVDDKDYFCHDCGWCEDEAKLSLCTCCEGRLCCKDCRHGTSVCLYCNNFDLNDMVQIVGSSERCDLEFNIRSWSGICCFASHYIVTAKHPFRKFGRMDFSYLIDRIYYRTTRPYLTSSYIRRILELLVRKHKRTIERRPSGKLFIRINDIDARYMLLKIESSRTLDGD